MKQRVCALTGAVLALFASSANAAELLDQSYLPTMRNIAVGYVNDDGAGDGWVQTVTAGFTGILSRIDIVGHHAPYGGFNILATLAGAPTMTVIGQANYVSSNGNIDTFSTSIAITAGEQFALEPFTSGVSFQYPYWDGSTANPYAGGNGYLKRGDSFASFANYDLGFQTFVTVPDVPEPATWAMMILGFGAIGRQLRRSHPGRGSVRFASRLV